MKASEVTVIADDDVYSKGQDLSHTEAMCLLQQRLAVTLQDDPLLSDLPAEVTLEEVNFQIALEHGQAITVYLQRGNDVLSIVVVQNGRVKDLKRAIQRHLRLKLSRENGPTHISWRYVWKSHWLVFEGQKLSDDNKLLKDYGVKNHSIVGFIKRLKEK